MTPRLSRLALDQLVDPLEARVVVERDASGAVVGARFDLSGLPRVDGLLLGRPVETVPSFVERLCGICPAAHHLAGMVALDALAGVTELPPTAVIGRRLLHVGSILDAHAPRLLAVDREAALALRALGKAAMRAAGSPGHFPTTAVPGGVRVVPDASELDASAALTAALGIAEALLARPGIDDGFRGLDLALTRDDGTPDLLGGRVRAVRGDEVVVDAPVADWPSLVDEARPGEPAPRPYLRALGTDGVFRVGPVAQLRVGVLSTPKAAELQERWLASGMDAAAARAIVAVHAVEEIARLAALPISGPLVADRGQPAASGTGLVDGPRGVLAHTYEAAPDGTLAAARILTPTAMNEPWLAELLQRALVDGSAALEESIRRADPCLPCSSAPPGGMGLVVVDREV